MIQARRLVPLSLLLAAACGGPAGTHITGAELAEYEGPRPSFRTSTSIEERAPEADADGPAALGERTGPPRRPSIDELTRATPRAVRDTRAPRRAATGADAASRAGSATGGADAIDDGDADRGAGDAGGESASEAELLTEALVARRRADPQRLLDHVDDLLTQARLRHDADVLLDEHALAEAERRVRAADAGVRHFVDVVEPQRLREADLDLRARLNDLVEQREEMAYLELTYADLAQAVSEVVLARQRRRLALAEDEYILAEERFAMLRDVELPRELDELEALATTRRVERDAVRTRNTERALARQHERRDLQLDRLAIEQELAGAGRQGAAASPPSAPVPPEPVPAAPTSDVPPRAGPDRAPDAASDTEPGAVADTEAGAVADTVADAEADAVTDTEAEAKADTVTDTEPRTESGLLIPVLRPVDG